MSDKLAAALHGSGPCCSKCKTPFGVCATKWACQHHRVHAMKEERAAMEAFSVEESKRMDGFKGWR